jgi:hypothetical protein
MRRSLATAAVLALTLAGTAGCSEDEPDTPDTETIEITFEGDTVTPNGERVEVATGQDIELVVKADAAGEIHVHADDEYTLEYTEGTTTFPLEPIDKPGVVDVESHDLDQIIVQLEVE